MHRLTITPFGDRRFFHRSSKSFHHLIYLEVRMKIKALKIVAAVAAFATSSSVLAAGACCAVGALCCAGSMPCCL